MTKIVHVVLFKVKAGCEAEHGIDNLCKLEGPIPGTAHTGPPLIDARCKGYNYGLYSIFASREDLDTYAVSKAHTDVVAANIRPYIEDVMAYDFEIAE